MQSAAAFKRDVLPLAMAGLLVTPLFVRVGGRSLLDLPESASFRISGGYTLPVGALLCEGLAVALLVWRVVTGREKKRGVLDGRVSVFAAVAVAIAIVGEIVRPGFVNLLYLAQTLAPLCAYYVATRLVRGETSARTAFGVMATVGAGWAIVLLANGVVDRGASVLTRGLPDHVGPLNIYQANDYVPFTFAALVAFSLAGFAARRELRLTRAASLLILAIVAMDSVSRGVVLVQVAGVVVLLVLVWNGPRSAAMRAAGVVGLALAFAIVFHLPSVSRVGSDVGAVARGDPLVTLPSGVPASALPVRSPSSTSAGGASPPIGSTATASPPIGSTATASPLATPTPTPTRPPAEDAPSNDTRVLSLRIALVYMLRSPVIGGGFAPIPAAELLLPSGSLGPTELFTPHDQYLDYGLRGGVLLLLAYVWLMLGAVGAAYSLARRGSGPSQAAGVGLLAMLGGALGVGNFYQSSFVQPFSAFVLWFLIGAVMVLAAPSVEAMPSQAA